MGGIADCSRDCKCRRSGAGDFARFGETGWQDIRAMYDLETSDGKIAPSWQDFYDMYSQTAVCGAFWIRGVQIVPKPAHFGYMAAISCHEEAFLSSEVPSGIHQGDISPGMRPFFCLECASRMLYSKDAPSSARNGPRKSSVQECIPSLSENALRRRFA